MHHRASNKFFLPHKTIFTKEFLPAHYPQIALYSPLSSISGQLATSSGSFSRKGQKFEKNT
jgi:hypothetical protein